MIRRVPATVGHAYDLAPRLNKESRLSLSLSEREPLDALLFSLSASQYAEAIFIGDDLALIWGVREVEPDVAVAWVMTSDVIDSHRKDFWRASGEVIAWMLDHYRLLVNVVHAENRRSLIWLRRMGFEIHPVEATGPNRLPFHRAELRSWRPNV